MNNVAIKVQNLTKEYFIDYSYTESFKEMALRRFRKDGGQHRMKTSKLLALEDVSFEVRKGESVGIIGKNGAGKSTLLRVLSGITKPTSGKVAIYGRLNSILDIGVGFHPELTGRENIIMSGEMNGMSRKEIRKRMDEIIDFSGVEKFIDTPVKYYSSGMFLRLAFSVISHIDADILLLDEVLSVGDASFQIKSYKKLQSMFGQGKTIVLVSHNPGDIIKLCSRCIMLEKGKVMIDGNPYTIICNYTEESIIDEIEEEEMRKPESIQNENMVKEEIGLEKPHTINKIKSWNSLDESPGNNIFRLLRVQIHADQKGSDDPLFTDEDILIEIEYVKLSENHSVFVGYTLNYFRNIVFASNAYFLLSEKNDYQGRGTYIVKSIIPGNLLNNMVYSLDIHVLIDKLETTLNFSDLLFFKIDLTQSKSIGLYKEYHDKVLGSVRPTNIKWDISKID